MCEVEAQAFRRDVGTCLFDVISEHAAQGGMQHMCRRMELRGGFRMVGQTAFELLLGARAGLLLMLRISFLEALFINLKSLFRSHFLRQFQREAIGFIEVERLAAADNFVLDVRRELLNQLVELLDTVFERLAELLFFAVQFRKDKLFLFFQFGIEGAVFVNDDFRDFRNERIRDAKLAGFADSAADQTTEDIALINVGRRDAIADNERGGAEMLRHDTCATVIEIRFRITAQLFDFREDTSEQLRLVGTADALHESRHAFNAHTRIDVWMLQRDELAVSRLVVLHKDVVPDFDPFAATASGTAIRTTVRTVQRNEHFGIRAAGAGLAGGPPPVVFFT